MIQLNSQLLQARLYHGLKSLLTPGDTLPPRFLEYAICEAFGLDHVGDGNFFADGVKGANQASIKTRQLSPDVRKRTQGRDFQSHPDKFLGYSFNKKHDRVTNGLEFIQRRQAFDGVDDLTAEPQFIGAGSINGFVENIKESTDKFKTTTSYEIIVVHGYDNSLSKYIISIFWQEYKPLDPKKVIWKREKISVAGYQEIKIGKEKKMVKICERYNGNCKRLATNFIEYKNPTKYKESAQIQLPIPDPWAFNKDATLTEIGLAQK